MDEHTGIARSGNDRAVLIVSVLLAIVFLLAGIPKLVGISPPGLQAAAMHGFPTWIRVITGAVEIVGAIGLLLPAVASFAAIALALLMIPAYVTQFISRQPGLIVPVIVFLLLLYVAWGRERERVRRGYVAAVSLPHPLLRDGVIAGVIGATCIAILFFIIDVSTGNFLLTPSVLGHALASIIAPNVSANHVTAFVIVYTIFHYAAFLVVGILAAFVVDLAAREPSILLGFVVLFAWLEVGFYGLVALLSQATPLGAFAWYDVMLGNIIALAAMGTYLWRAHPHVGRAFQHAFDGEDYRHGTPGVNVPPRA